MMEVDQEAEPISLSDVMVRLSPMWCHRAEGVVVFSDANFDLSRIVLNPVGGRIWELIDGSVSLDQIAGVLASEYPAASLADITKGVLAFAEELRREWLAMSRQELKTYE